MNQENMNEEVMNEEVVNEEVMVEEVMTEENIEEAEEIVEEVSREEEVTKAKDTTAESGNKNIGNVVISENVVASIAGIAASEVAGVSKLTSNFSKEIISKLSKKTSTNGVKIDIDNEVVAVELSIEIEYGNNIKTVCEEVQVKVKQAIESMTGMTVREVNVSISGIKLDKN